MNIFKTSDDPTECARVLADQHVIKMSTETAQILSTALRQLGSQEDGLYRITHKNHPCVVWVRQSREAANWTLKHGFALCDEYTFRYGKVHGARSRLELIAGVGFDLIPDHPAPEAPKCVFDDLKHLPLHEAYLLTLGRKYEAWLPPRQARWTRREVSRGIFQP